MRSTESWAIYLFYITEAMARRDRDHVQELLNVSSSQSFCRLSILPAQPVHELPIPGSKRLVKSSQAIVANPVPIGATP
jgi:hypothetical protein